MENAPDVSPELSHVRWRLLLGALSRLPQGALSRAFGALADVPIPRPLRRPILGAFARTVGARVDEAEYPLDHYPSLNAFFVRRLRPGLRSWTADPHSVASPVDGIVGRFGRVARGRAIQAKGRDYSVADLLGAGVDAHRFEGGAFLTIYLSPRHYHRIHSPVGGSIRQARYVAGALLPVNAAAVTHVSDLFPRNERLVCHIDWPGGALALVAVGAYNVGRISAAFDPAWSGDERRPWITNRRTPPPPSRGYDPPVAVEAGREIMAFHLGSTVVVLFEPGVELRGDLAPGREILVGDEVAFVPQPTGTDRA